MRNEFESFQIEILNHLVLIFPLCGISQSDDKFQIVNFKFPLQSNGPYLILFAPHAFVPQCQGRPSKLPSLLVFPTISTDFTPTPSVPFASNALLAEQYYQQLKG